MKLAQEWLSLRRPVRDVTVQCAISTGAEYIPSASCTAPGRSKRIAFGPVAVRTTIRVPPGPTRRSASMHGVSSRRGVRFLGQSDGVS